MTAPDGTTAWRFLNPSRRAIEEWRGSAIDEEIIATNLLSFPDMLCQSGTARSPLRQIVGLENSPVWTAPLSCSREGWSYRGYDPVADREKSWFEVKPLPPLRARAGYPVKYEVTQGQSGTAYLLVPPSIAERILGRSIADRSSVSEPATVWREVLTSSHPVVITEGAKKAAAFLSMGIAAVGVLGVCHAVEWGVADNGRRTATLARDLSPLTAVRRTIYISFDNDPEPENKVVVSSMVAIFGQLLEEAGADVWVIDLPGPEKGPDDFIAARGRSAMNRLIGQSITIAEWRAGKLNLEPVDLLGRRWWCPHTCEGLCSAYQ